MPRIYGYAFKGQRCFGTHNWGARGRTNAIGALFEDKLLTLSLFDSNINGALFESWVHQDLMPKLPLNSVLVMDNATFHKRAKLIESILNAGHILEFLPPYSPEQARGWHC